MKARPHLAKKAALETARSPDLPTRNSPFFSCFTTTYSTQTEFKGYPTTASATFARERPRPPLPPSGREMLARFLHDVEPS